MQEKYNMPLKYKSKKLHKALNINVLSIGGFLCFNVLAWSADMSVAKNGFPVWAALENINH